MLSIFQVCQVLVCLDCLSQVYLSKKGLVAMLVRRMFSLAE